MLNAKYRALIAAVLVGAVLFSPLVCGMTCLEAGVEKSGAAAEVMEPAGELAGEFVVSAVVGCVLTHVVLRLDGSEWRELAAVGSWFWVGVKIVRFVEGR